MKNSLNMSLLSMSSPGHALRPMLLTEECAHFCDNAIRPWLDALCLVDFDSLTQRHTIGIGMRQALEPHYPEALEAWNSYVRRETENYGGSFRAAEALIPFLQEQLPEQRFPTVVIRRQPLELGDIRGIQDVQAKALPKSHSYFQRYETAWENSLTFEEYAKLSVQTLQARGCVGAIRKDFVEVGTSYYQTLAQACFNDTGKNDSWCYFIGHSDYKVRI